MKLLIACEHHPITPARYMTEAFAALGVDVRHIGTGHGSNTGFSDTPRPDLEWTPQGNYQKSWADWKPDVVLYLDTISAFYHHTVYATVPHIWYHIEGLMDNVMPGMAHYFHATSYGPNWDTVPQKMTWVPPAYDPNLHTPSAIPWEQREYDICLIGRHDAKRDWYVEAFRAAGLKVFSAKGLINGDYVAAYHNARMSLIEHFSGIVPMRTFESAAMGNLLFSQWFIDYDRLGIQGVAILPDLDTAARAARELLDRPDECKRLVSQSLEWVKPHTWESRAQQIIDWYTEAR
jgi:glycosyltransferase involved in cell wall biosynthesis